ncbi:MAG: class I tRNA ligase family protein, partial [Anaerolineales bacterium]|nr:class I tRNA ligase family protein [Anaerolineales bacterium]
LWWGHRIPVWYVNGDEKEFIVAHSEEEAYEIARDKFGAGVTLRQDPDVLDTWFSSALWPFSTLGWPEQTDDLARFFPTDVMETGYDILFFWVARMVMTSLLFTNDIPFHTIYLHGLVRDEHGQKMSKTKGNVTDPLKVMGEYGTDALRFTLLTGGTPGHDLNLSLERVASNRNFANKIWNAARFITRSLEKATAEDKPDQLEFTAADQWILTNLSTVTRDANRLFNNYQFGEAGRQVYDFLWGDFADWYVELAKVQLSEGGSRAWTTLFVLRHVLDDCLRLLHPYIPFVTEETWQQLKQAFVESEIGIQPVEGWADALIVADWPECGEWQTCYDFSAAAADFEQLRELVTRIRAARSEQGVEPAKWITAMIAAGDKGTFYQSQHAILSFLARLDPERLTIAANLEAPTQALTLALGDLTCYLPLAGMVDLDKEKERLQKESGALEKEIQRLTNLLNSPFAQKAPTAVVQKERDKLAQLQASHAELSERLNTL